MPSVDRAYSPTRWNNKRKFGRYISKTGRNYNNWSWKKLYKLKHLLLNCTAEHHWKKFIIYGDLLVRLLRVWYTWIRLVASRSKRVEAAGDSPGAVHWLIEALPKLSTRASKPFEKNWCEGRPGSCPKQSTDKFFIYYWLTSVSIISSKSKYCREMKN